MKKIQAAIQEIMTLAKTRAIYVIILIHTCWLLADLSNLIHFLNFGGCCCGPVVEHPSKVLVWCNSTDVGKNYERLIISLIKQL